MEIVRGAGGRQLDVRLQRGGQELSLAISPRLNPGGGGQIDSFLAPNTQRLTGAAAARGLGPVAAGKEAVRETNALVGNTVAALRNFAATGNGEGMAGPVGVGEQPVLVLRYA